MDELIPNEANFFLYTAPNGEVRVDVIIQDETVWLTQKSMGELFGVEANTITYHLGEIYKTGELEAETTTRKIRVVRQEGNRQVTRSIDFYNLDTIISVGYRVNSRQATQFRIWATKTLKEYLIKGFAMDDERLKQGNTLFGKDYFKELLERVRSIRASERRIYQQITDIFAECSIDYDRNSELTKTFYATIQNKFHFAITGHTAAEIIYKLADSQKENMGLTTWKNSPDGRILKSDTTVAKNYLSEKEIKQLERTVSGYFDYIENLIERRQTFTMAALAESVNKFLAFNEYHVLENSGKITKLAAEQKAGEEYDKFNKTQKIVSDFDKEVKKLQGKKKP
ncbi:virulence RhuM family protein [Adhaeribacter sp. BT258]|uniref:Virulence RhuM family protein n=1 Tax=Adhaeribacter terrigena TaxID=2793070 RepID=A0ABS1C2B7_9BACT|nr:virulence RhuM family protein [Adhaeribacter terrigena]MBK0403469.1 virulence RhuM family protein [Adhaeribacter terrigena]